MGGYPPAAGYPPQGAPGYPPTGDVGFGGFPPGGGGGGGYPPLGEPALMVLLFAYSGCIGEMHLFECTY